jgi:hypothetical protein
MHITHTVDSHISGFDRFKTRIKGLFSRGLLLALVLNIICIGAPSALAASLSGTSVVPSSNLAGATVNVVASFTAPNNIPADGKIKIIFPTGFDISTVMTADVTSSLDGTFTASVSSQTLTVLRMNDGTAMSGAHTITINNKIKNPSSAGVTSTYTIRTTDSADTEIDSNSSVSGTNILPVTGSLTSASVTPSSLVAGANTNVNISFTAANNIPSDGKIKITFPAGFDISSVQSADISSSLSGSFTTSLNGQILTIIRSGGSAQSGARTITIGNSKVKNPSSAGATGTFSMATTTNSDVDIDTVSGVSGVTITSAGGSLTSASVVPTSLIASANSNVVVSFTAATSIPANGKIKIIFPAGFDISDVVSADITSNLDGSFSTSISSQTLTITRSGGSAQSGARTITIGNSKITNPSTAGATGTYTITTTSSSDTVLDSNNSVSGNTIIAAGTLTNATVVPASLVTSAYSNVLVSFKAASNIPANGKIKITFPSGFNISDVESDDISSTLDGDFTTSISNLTLTITRSGGTSLKGSHTITIGNNKVKNRTTAGVTGTYTITTTSSSDVVIDSNSAVPGNTLISAGALTGTSVVPASLAASASSNVVVSFTATNNIPLNGKIKVTFPTGFSIGSVQSADISSTLDGTFTASVSGQILTITRAGGTAQKGAQTVTIGNNKIKNPSSSGLTGTYTIATTSSSDVVVDMNSSVTGTTISSVGALTAVSVVPNSLYAGNNTNMVVSFTATNSIPATGKIKIVFPAGFDISAVKSSDISSTLDGTFTAVVSGQTLTVTRAGGTAQSGTKTVTINNSKIKNPYTVGQTGTFSITTMTSADVSVDTNTSVAGVKIVEATNCAGYSDVVPSDADCEAFKFVQSIGAMTGNPDGTLNPTGTLQRDQVTKIVLFKTFVKGTDYCKSVNPFPDVTSVDWSFQYICKGVQDALITGYKSGADTGFYRPARLVNRAEFAALLLRNLKSETIPSNSSVSYSDVPADSWFSGYAKYFKDNDLISGDTFSATAPLSRREVAQIMYKLHLLGKI